MAVDRDDLLLALVGTPVMLARLMRGLSNAALDPAVD